MIAFFQPKLLAGKRVLDHRRADLRADRSGARPQQPLERQDGLRDRARRRRGRRRRHAGRRPGRARHAAPRAPRRRDDGRRDARRGDGRGAATRRLRRHRRGRRLARRRTSRGEKIKKVAGQGAPTFALVENPDILASRRGAGEDRRSASASPPRSGDVLANASAKRLKKNVPLIVGNLGPATFGQDDNALTLIDAQRRARAAARRQARARAPARRRDRRRGSAPRRSATRTRR